MKKEYLGDGCYIQTGNFKKCILLTCEDGTAVYEKIHLEPIMIERLYEYYQRLRLYEHYQKLLEELNYGKV